MNILVLCTGNSARSILLESILNGLSNGRITAFSAGSHPTGTVNPYAIYCLNAKGLPADNLRSKSWDEFANPDSPKIDLVITVCGNARGEECPYWPGTPLTVHWGVEDPALVNLPDKAAIDAFSEAYNILHHRACALLDAPFEDFCQADLKQLLKTISKMTP